MDISDVSKVSLLYYYDKKTLIVIIIRCSRHMENTSLVIFTLVQLFKVGYKVCEVLNGRFICRKISEFYEMQ